MSATSEDDVFSFCSSKNADVTVEDDDVTVNVTAGCDDPKATDTGRELQNMMNKDIYKTINLFICGS